MRNPNYVIGRGKLFFTPFLVGTKTLAGSERYLGNSPELAVTQTENKVDHWSSDAGIKVKDASVTLDNELNMTFKLDDIAPENLALWFRGTADANVLAAVVAGTTEALGVAKGGYVQLGLSVGNQIGARNVSNVTANFGAGAGAVLTADQYTVEPATGRVYIHEDAADILADGTTRVVFTYDAAGGAEDVVIAQGSLIQGRLHFVADNATGENRDFIWPFAVVRPNGTFNLKGDAWQEMDFTVEVLKLNASTERQYIVKR